MGKPNLPAAEGGSPVRKQSLPFAKPMIGDDEIAEVVDTLKSGWLTVGPKTRRLERVVADYVGTVGGAALNSCTAGLHLTMVAYGVGSGDEVVMPALNFAAAANMAVHLGAKPVLADIDPETMNVTAELLDERITNRTKLLLPIDFAGRPCDMDPIMELARARNLRVLEDAAHAIGADYKGRKVGAIADATSFSFYVTKGITTGEGGMVTSDDPELLHRLTVLSLHGMSSDAWKRNSEKGHWYYEILEAGYKCNMNDMQAALGLRQMEKVDWLRDEREKIAIAYGDAFAETDGIRIPIPFDQGHHAWHLYTIQILTDVISVSRDAFIESLRQEGIGASVHFIPLHKHPFYRKRLGHEVGALPATERYYERAVSLPIYPGMTDEDVTDVISAVSKLLRYYKR